MSPSDRVYTGEMSLVGPAPGPGGPPQPLYLLADSQLLYWAERGESWLRGVLDRLPEPRPRAAYLGASNGDQPEFYEIFTGAMEAAGIPAARCRMIPAAPSAADLEFLDAADVVLLSGGDPRRGWDAFTTSGLTGTLVRRWHEGAALIGISAGAVQLGRLAWPEDDPSPGSVFTTWGLAPFVVSAHDEETDWRVLRRVVGDQGPGTRGVGVPRGGGLVYHPDHTVEAVRHPVFEVENRDGELATSLIFPPQTRLSGESA